MKVILLAATPPPAGGIQSWTVRMLNANLKNGWEIDLVDEKTIGGRMNYSDNYKRNVFVEAKRCLGIWKNLWKELKKPDAKIVHSCIPAYTLSMMREYVCACITKLHKRKFIVHFRCTVPIAAKTKSAKFMLKLLCKKSDLIIILNEESKAYLETLTDTELVLIPNFITEEDITESKKINEKMTRISYIGGVVRTKGVYEIIETAEYFKDVEFRLVGPYGSDVVNFLETKNISNVVLTGSLNREEVRKELETTDVFMFLSYFPGEGFSNSLCEAMAAGVPCIVTRWAANADMIEDKGGVIVPIKNVKSVVDAIKKIQPSEIRKEMSDFNIEKVKNNYTEEIILERYVDAYESLLN